jgi:WD40 repeat protein
VKFGNFSVNTSNSSQPEVNLSLLPIETTSGTGYPPITHSLLISDLIWLAREGGAVEAFSVPQNKLTETVVFPFLDDHKIVGLFPHENDHVMAVSSHGELAFWSHSDSAAVTRKTLPQASNIQAVAKLGNFLAVGGKGSKNNLKVFNLEDLTVTLFTAKATLNTRLNLPFNIDIRAICFTSLEKPETVAVANSDGQIFFYDFSRQTSSLLHHQVLPKKTVLTSIFRTEAESDSTVIYTDVTGIIERYDLLKGKSSGRFKPQEGAVNSFLISGNNSILLTISKDRFLRIFNLSTRSLLHKVYLKHSPATITITRQDWLEAHAQQYEDSEDEEVWEGMTRKVDDKKKRAKIDK